MAQRRLRATMGALFFPEFSSMFPFGRALVVLFLWSGIVAPVAAQGTFPDRPIRFVVPFPPGGGADNLARAIVPKASQILGVPIVIDNKPGAGGNIGAAEVARAAPDGYTLVVVSSTFTTGAAIRTNLPYDATRDLKPVAMLRERYARRLAAGLTAAMAVTGPQVAIAGQVLAARPATP